MKKFIVLFSFFFLFFLFILTPAAFAKVVTVEKGAYEVTKDEVINDDLFVGAETVLIEGTVNGDVYAGGESVRVTGTINGDLHIGAGTVYLSGKVDQDVYIGAGNVSLTKASIGDSLLVGAGNVNIDKDSTIGGSLIVGSRTLSAFSPIKRNLMVGAGNVELNSVVGGEARIGAGSISIGPDTKIAKDLYYALGEEDREINLSKTASVGGVVQKINTEFARSEDIQRARQGLAKGSKTFKYFLQFISLIGAFIVGVLGLKFFRKTFIGSAEIMSTSFFKTMGVGFLVTFFAIPVLLMLAVTGVGIPLAGVLILILLLKIYLSKIVFATFLGNWVSRKFSWKMNDYMVLALGLVLFYVFKAIPFFGFLVTLVVLWTGLGALTLHLKYEMASKKEVEVKEKKNTATRI